METYPFLKRALVFLSELQKGTYPNASSLGKLCSCSRSTAMRTIDRLRYEFGAPLAYDESERGYFLRDPSYSFNTLPPGQDELVALVLLTELSQLIDDKAIATACSTLWARCTNGRADLELDLSQIAKRFSSDTTSVAQLAETNLVRLLGFAHRGQPVEITYRSPWRHSEDKTYQGTFDRFHYSDGILYGMFHEVQGRHIVLNMSFVSSLEELAELPEEDASISQAEQPYWLEGFGVWSGEKPTTISITIAAPASRYYAKQTWHDDQQDTWEGGNLIRTFPGIPSPELSRRILSLGRYVVGVEPASVLDDIVCDVDSLQLLVQNRGS